MLSEGHVKTRIDKHIATITFYHPKGNSLPGDLLKKLAGAISTAGKDMDARVIILRSEGEKVFCGGASFDELIAIRNRKEGILFFSGFARLINTMRLVPKFIIARVQARIAGGGIGLAAAADYAMAVKDASIRLSELALGIGPFVVGPPVERKIGTSAFISLTINPAEWKSAEWACRKGLYNEIYPDIRSLDAAIKNISEKLAESSREAMAELKKMMWAGTEHWDELLMKRAEISARLVLSDQTKKAIERLKNA